jgi:thiol-disulfide isomerase/thioredoxin|tara:strand:+ start:593 stop:1225 length:633 start_codon:yes stop_codon:yes gene_type:complete
MEGDLRGNSMADQTISHKNNRKRSKLRWLVPLALVLTVAAIACGNSTTDNSQSIVGDESSSSGELAPDFSVTMFQGQDVVGGDEVSLHSLFGDKPIVLNFWAGLCPPCRAEMPDLQEFYDKFEDRAILLGIDLGQFTGLGNQEEAKELLAELEITYPAGFTEDESVVRDYQVLGMPTTIFIDADGMIFNKWTGALNGSVLEEKTLEMLAQ